LAWGGKLIHFILIISGTDLIKYPGISAAGASQDMLKYTACLDAEFIYHGRLKTFDKLPVSPSGIVSPALISKACLKLLNVKVTIIDAGAHVKPKCPTVELRAKPSADISNGHAMTLSEVEELYAKALEFTSTIDPTEEVIIAECVVAGTTTAYALLRGLGYSCDRLVSSSVLGGNHEMKEQIVERALLNYQPSNNPLQIVAQLGDPMQVVATALSLKLRELGTKINLAGGTQMLAVKALIDRIADRPLRYPQLNPSSWVVNDCSADFRQLLSLCSLKTELDYIENFYDESLDEEVQKLSSIASGKKINLKEIFSEYDKGHVKEGVGMGGLLLALKKSRQKAYQY
jgi:uncharacterized protein (TIGR00303 family)